LFFTKTENDKAADMTYSKKTQNIDEQGQEDIEMITYYNTWLQGHHTTRRKFQLKLLSMSLLPRRLNKKQWATGQNPNAYETTYSDSPD
jgi:hypothetical protein